MSVSIVISMFVLGLCGSMIWLAAQQYKCEGVGGLLLCRQIVGAIRHTYIEALRAARRDIAPGLGVWAQRR
jgi:hypothetical protein